MNSGPLVLRRQWPLDVRHTAYLLAACIAALLGVIVASRPGPAPVGVPRASSVARSPHELAELAFPEQAAVARTIGGSDRTYWVRRSAGGLSALGAGLTTSFRAAGVVVRADGRSAGLSLGAVGRGAALAPVAAAIPRASHNRVVYDRGSLQEWYANGPAGLEQGFRLARRPAASAAGALTLSLALSGGLHAALDANQLGLTLRTAAGRAVLRYTGLSATDALGHRLAAHLALRGERVLIVVDDAHARYPIAVDPFVQSALLTASKGDPGQYIGSSVAASADGRTLAIAGPNAGLGVIYVFTEPTGGWTNMTQTTELHTPSSVNSNPPWGSRCRRTRKRSSGAPTSTPARHRDGSARSKSNRSRSGPAKAQARRRSPSPATQSSRVNARPMSPATPPTARVRSTCSSSPKVAGKRPKPPPPAFWVPVKPKNISARPWRSKEKSSSRARPNTEATGRLTSSSGPPAGGLAPKRRRQN